MTKRIVTREDVEAARAAGSLEIADGDVVTEAARDLAGRIGVSLTPARAGGLPPLPSIRDASAVVAEAGPRCIVTVVGRNRPFVLSELTTRISELHGNIQDISQRIVGDYFSTILIVDIERVAAFGDFKGQVEGLSTDGDYKVVVQHERIFQAMHRL